MHLVCTLLSKLPRPCLILPLDSEARDDLAYAANVKAPCTLNFFFWRSLVDNLPLALALEP